MQGRPHFDLGVYQPSRPHHLFHHRATGTLQLERAGRGGNEHGLAAQPLELVEAQRPVVQRTGQTEAVLDQGFLARTVTLVHRPQLRDGDVAFVDEDERVRRQVIEQGRRRLARLAARQVAGIVLDAAAIAQFQDHLDVEAGALFQPLRFQQLVGGVQFGQPLPQFVLDLIHRPQKLLARGDVVALRIDGITRRLAQHLAGQRIEQAERLDFVVEQFHPQGFLIGLGGVDVDDFAAHPKRAARQFQVVAGVL